jgi:hypothetical protein
MRVLRHLPSQAYGDLEENKLLLTAAQVARELGELVFLGLKRRGVAVEFDKFMHDFVHDPRGSGLSDFLMFEETDENHASIKQFAHARTRETATRPDNIIYTHNTLCFAFDKYYIPFKFIKCIPHEGSIFFLRTDSEIAEALANARPFDCFGTLSV